MNLYLLDTDMLTHYLRHHAGVLQTMLQHLSDELAISVITIEEIWNGWQAAIRAAKKPEDAAKGYQRLTELITETRYWSILGFDQSEIQRYMSLKRMKLNVGTNDLRIAAIALERGATLVTANQHDFQRIPGLSTTNWI
jgi:tRNA(fMet)-specific endonuclease VapC